MRALKTVYKKVITFCQRNFCMKIFCIFFLLPLQMLAQPTLTVTKDITGIWKGTVSTPEKKLAYELVIGNENGKLTGYSHITFIVNKEEIIAVKKVTIRFNNQSIIIEDDELMYNNFTSEAPKKIIQTNTVFFNDEGKTLTLSGTFETKVPRVLKTATGDIFLEKKDNPDGTKLMAKLDEMKLSGALTFTPAAAKLSEPMAVAAANAEKTTPAKRIEKSVVSNETVPVKLNEEKTIASVGIVKNNFPSPEKSMNDTTALATNKLLIDKNNNKEKLIAPVENKSTKEIMISMAAVEKLKKDSILLVTESVAEKNTIAKIKNNDSSNRSTALLKSDNSVEILSATAVTKPITEKTVPSVLAEKITTEPLLAKPATINALAKNEPKEEKNKPIPEANKSIAVLEKITREPLLTKPATINALAKNDPKEEKNKLSPPANNTTAATLEKVKGIKTEVVKEKIPETTIVASAKPLNKITTPAPAKPITKTTPVLPVVTKPVATIVKQPAPIKPVAVAKAASVTPAPVSKPVVLRPAPVNITVAPALDLAKRKIETIQQLFIESDSLQFTLYDNGEVDGDTVSIILNGKTIVSRQGLTTTAFTKTVYITPDLGDTIQLIMYAENLGALPPNTGLLVLQYDNKRQEIRFSGDLNKNAAITLRRKEKN